MAKMAQKKIVAPKEVSLGNNRGKFVTKISVINLRQKFSWQTKFETFER
jgi:hypothetical protein